jgi:hypothetical protein
MTAEAGGGGADRDRACFDHHDRFVTRFRNGYPQPAIGCYLAVVTSARLVAAWHGEVRMGRTDHPDGAGREIPGIEVDASGLDRFVASVESGVDANYRPQAGRLMSVYRIGGHFGLGHPAQEVHAAHAKYAVCLENANQQLAGFANAVKIMVDAARLVTARYRQADGSAAASQDLVDEALIVARNKAVRALGQSGVPDAGSDVPKGAA